MRFRVIVYVATAPRRLSITFVGLVHYYGHSTASSQGIDSQTTPIHAISPCTELRGNIRQGEEMVIDSEQKRRGRYCEYDAHKPENPHVSMLNLYKYERVPKPAGT